MKKTILNYGLISGGIAAVLMMVTSLILKNSLNFDSGYIYGYAGILLSLVVIYFAVKRYRDKMNNGFITFGRALMIGLAIAFISGVFYSASWLLVNKFIMPDFVDQFCAYQIQHLQDSGKSAQEIADAKAELDKYREAVKNPLMNFAYAFTEPFPVGVLVSLITALILRRKPANGQIDQV